MSANSNLYINLSGKTYQTRIQLVFACFRRLFGIFLALFRVYAAFYHFKLYFFILYLFIKKYREELFP